MLLEIIQTQVHNIRYTLITYVLWYTLHYGDKALDSGNLGPQKTDSVVFITNVIKCKSMGLSFIWHN